VYLFFDDLPVLPELRSFLILGPCEKSVLEFDDNADIFFSESLERFLILLLEDADEIRFELPVFDILPLLPGLVVTEGLYVFPEKDCLLLNERLLSGVYE